MTREEIKNTPEIVDFMIDKSVIADSRMKLHKRMEELCKLAIKALEQEPKTGHWIEHEQNGISHIECSECLTWFLRCHLLRNSFCPNCGAKMVEPQESEDKK